METTQWSFPTLAHVWDYRTGAIMAGGTRLDGLSGTDREHCLAALTERVKTLVGQLDDGWLVATSFFMVEDLYKSFFGMDRWAQGVEEYIAHTASVVVQELAHRGFVLHYVIDATQTKSNLVTLLTYVPTMFAAAGLAVVGPQLVAAELLKRSQAQPPEDIAEIQRYREQGHTIADEVIDGWHQERRSSAYLNLDLDDGLPGLALDVALSQRGTSRTIVVFRDEPPTQGSRAQLTPPPGVALPPGMPGHARASNELTRLPRKLVRPGCFIRSDPIQRRPATGDIRQQASATVGTLDAFAG